MSWAQAYLPVEPTCETIRFMYLNLKNFKP